MKSVVFSCLVAGILFLLQAGCSVDDPTQLQTRPSYQKELAAEECTPASFYYQESCVVPPIDPYTPYLFYDEEHRSVELAANFPGQLFDGVSDVVPPLNEAWNPSTNGCMPPDILPSGRPKRTLAYCHFRIRNANGTCILFSGVLHPNLYGNQWYQLGMSLPVDDILSGQNIEFSRLIGSDYDEFLLYFASPNFRLKPGFTYLFEITSQFDIVSPSRVLAEKIVHSQSFQIPLPLPE